MPLQWGQIATIAGVCGFLVAVVVLQPYIIPDEDELAQGQRVGPGGKYKKFVPTMEFQEVPEGAAIPPGLEVRMDLASGKSYARLCR
mmetsp:Transcript_4817/g.6761  ORF Transcript_4817/g.6761 Transcript_4817/m.6761 type:complete len:87 (-) Transcript_4817:490-750(-)